MLLEKGAELNPPGVPLLHIACHSGAAEWKTEDIGGETRSVEHTMPIIRLLLQQGVNANAISYEGDTALYRACVSQQLELVQILLEAGADVNLTSKKLYPMMAACEACNVELFNLLVKAGADVKCSNNNNETCLHAVLNSSTTDSQKPADILSVVKSLVEAGVDVETRASQGHTALYRASKAGHEEIVRLLLEAGAETNDSTRCHPLYAACQHGHTQIVDLLLHHGADPNVLSTSSESSNLGRRGLASLPILCAVQKGYSDIVNLLLKHGADVNKQDELGKSAFITFLEMITSQRSTSNQVSNPLEERDLNTLKSMLLAGGDVNTLARHSGHNALHIASSVGMCDVMAELFRHGVDCNRPTSSGKSALDLACEKGHEDAVELLLKNGARPDMKISARPKHAYRSYSNYDSCQCSTPVLFTAVKSNNESMLKMLLLHGANINESDEKGNTALHLATSKAIIETLLNAGADVNATNDKGETALGVVCQKAHADTTVVEMLLKFGADPNACFPLHSACNNNDLETVRLLLSHGADANLVKECRLLSRLLIPEKCIKLSPLCIACKNGNKAIVDCLLTNGADVSFADSDGKSALYYAIDRLEQQANSEQYDLIVTILLKHNAPVNVVSIEGETPLYVACSKGLTGVVKQLIDCKAALGLTRNDLDKYPLMIACERKFRDIALMLLGRGAATNVTKDKQTPLKLAAENGDPVLVKELLTCGADVNQMHGISDTALHIAVVQRRKLRNEALLNIVQRLLKSGAELNALNHNGETPLYLACKLNLDVNIDIVVAQILLEHGADPDMCPSCSIWSRWSSDCVLAPLTFAAMCGNSQLVLLLIKFGARIDHSDGYHGRTALHYAVYHDDTYYIRHAQLAQSNTGTCAAEKLLSAGANVNAMDKKGASPLYLACVKGKTEFVKMLLSHGANPNIGTTNSHPILAACNSLHYDSVTLLLNYNADVNVRDGTGRTALHHVLESGTHRDRESDQRTVLAQLLVDRGADVNAISQNGETPFYIACSKSLESVARKMLENGAKVNGNSNKKLPLNVACRNKHVSIVKLLLISGANPNTWEEGNEDCYRRSSSILPLYIAAQDGNSELMELLLKHSAKVGLADTDGNTALHHAVQRYRPTASSLTSPYPEKVMSSICAKSVVDILLENKADVNFENNSGETPLYRAASRELPDVASKMLQVYGGNPNKGSLDKNPLVAACLQQNVELVDTLLKHGADPNLTSKNCDSGSKHKVPLLVAAEEGNDDIITLLLNAGANVNATNDKGKGILYLSAENLIGGGYYYSSKESERISTIRLLLQHGAKVNVLTPNGCSPLSLAVSALEDVNRRGVRYRPVVIKLLQLLVKHGAMLNDSFPELGTVGRQLLNSAGTLLALATFDGRHEFIVELFRAGARFQLTAFCCSALATSLQETKSIRLCQAAMLDGYAPSDEELYQLQVELSAARDKTAGDLIQQLMNWVNEDRQQVPGLLRQCRVAIRRQLSVAAHYATILPAIEQLPLPANLKLYLQFDGILTEVDLSVNKKLQTSETTEETLLENTRQLSSPIDYSDFDDDYFDDYGYSAYESDDDYKRCFYGRDSIDDEYMYRLSSD